MNALAKIFKNLKPNQTIEFEVGEGHPELLITIIEYSKKLPKKCEVFSISQCPSDEEFESILIDNIKRCLISMEEPITIPINKDFPFPPGISK